MYPYLQGGPRMMGSFPGMPQSQQGMSHPSQLPLYQRQIASLPAQKLTPPFALLSRLNHQVVPEAFRSADQVRLTRQVQQVWRHNSQVSQGNLARNRKGKAKEESSIPAIFRHWEGLRGSRAARPVLAVSTILCRVMRRRQGREASQRLFVAALPCAISARTTFQH